MRLQKLILVLFAVGLALTPAIAQASPTSSSVSAHRGAPITPHFVNLFARATGQAGTDSAAATKPFRHATVPSSVSGAHRPASSKVLTMSPATSSFLTRVTSFPLTNLDAQVSALGVDQAAEPPDTMLAAGPTVLVETVNSSASIWTKTGTRIAIADFNKALPMPAGFSFSDPRILFDTASGRFFFSGVGFSLTSNSLIFLGVSKTNDPSGGFFVYKVAQTSNGQLHDQPKIGVSDDKVVISTNEFCCGLLGTFRGAETFVFQKSTLLTGSVTPVFFVGPNPGQSSPVPVQSLSSTGPELVVFNGGTFAGVLSIDGTPALNNVIITETDLPIPATAVPPKAVQPGGSIETNDDRFLSAVWDNGDLWVSGNDRCTPAGTSTPRSCLRLVQISAITQGGMSPTLTQSIDVGKSEVDFYYPAVTLDSTHNLFVSFSASTPAVFPSAAVVEIAAGPPPATIAGSAVFQQGAKKYGGTRWGDYSAISVDPATGAIWAAAEYSAAGSSRNWGTAAGEFTP
jgi:hypothetical protein